MTALFILLLLLVFIGGIYFSIVRDRKVQRAEPLKKTLTFAPSSEAQPSTSTTSDLPHNSCALATALRIVGVANVFAALIIGLVLADDFSWVISIAVILSGGLGCLFCYALAKCVDAADKYLNSH